MYVPDMAVNNLLPTRSEVEVETEPKVHTLDQAADVFEALSSRMAREILSTLYDSPAPASEIAEEVDTSIQNADYHLTRLEAAGLVETADTWYSRKGNEMDIYVPTSAPLVLFAGDTSQEDAMVQAIDECAGNAVSDA